MRRNQENNYTIKVPKSCQCFFDDKFVEKLNYLNDLQEVLHDRLSVRRLVAERLKLLEQGPKVNGQQGPRKR